MAGAGASGRGAVLMSVTVSSTVTLTMTMTMTMTMNVIVAVCTHVGQRMPIRCARAALLPGEVPNSMFVDGGADGRS